MLKAKRYWILDARYWINQKKNSLFNPVSLRGVGSTLRPVSPTGWPPARRGTILCLGEKRSRRPETSIQHHVVTARNCRAFQKFDTNVKILAYIGTYCSVPKVLYPILAIYHVAGTLQNVPKLEYPPAMQST